MILMAIVVGLAAAVVACVINIVEDIRRKNNSGISFKESMDLTELPVVTFYNHGKKLNFLIDTGSNISSVARSALATGVDYKIVNKKIDAFGVEGVKVNNPICEMKVTYKNLEFDEEFCVADLDEAFDIVKKESGVQIHGILGSKFFEKYKYVLDFKELKAYII